jgi:hypothetical protein
MKQFATVRSTLTTDSIEFLSIITPCFGGAQRGAKAGEIIYMARIIQRVSGYVCIVLSLGFSKKRFWLSFSHSIPENRARRASHMARCVRQADACFIKL